VVDTFRHPAARKETPVEAHLGRDRGHPAVGSRDYSYVECTV
jgi:hypothetical protein